MKKLPKYQKDFIVFFTLLVFCLFSIYGSYRLYDYGANRTHSETRHARMIGVFDNEEDYKGQHYYYTYGNFLDYKSGQYFVAPITVLTFNSFKKDGNKPIETSWVYSIDEMERTVKGGLAQMAGFVGVIFFTFFGIFNLSELIMTSQKRKEYLYQRVILYNKSL